MKISVEELPSGSYRIKKTYRGKTYRVTLDHKPKQRESEDIILKMIQKDTISDDMPFSRACDHYIDTKTNVLSPATIRGYKGLIKQISPHFLNDRISSMTLPKVQTEINRYSATHSPKSVRNMSGFIMSVLKYYGVQIQSPKLPQKQKNTPYIPTVEEVKAIMNAAKGSKYEIALYLAGLGLRRSEICALTIFDLKDNMLTINKALVQDENEKWCVKETKTTESTRTIPLPDELADMIRKQGYIYDGYPSTINMYLHSLQDELGIERFSLHKLRHFFASYLHSLGTFTDKQIMEMGGWKTDNIMKTVYTHAMEMDKAKEQASQAIFKAFS